MMSKRAREEDLLEQVRELCEEPDKITTAMAVAKIREFGYQPLVQALQVKGQTSGALLSRTVFMSLYTLGMKAKEAAPPNLDTLAAEHESMIREYLTGFTVRALSGKHGELLLAAFCEQWNSHRMLTEWLRRMFVYIDKDAQRAGGKPRSATLTSLGLRLFNSIVFERKKGVLSSTIIQLINKDREGETVNRSMLKTAVSMYAIIGVCQQDATLVSDEQVERKIASAHGGVHAVYASDFEAPFLASSRTYYRAKAEAWMGSDSTPVYLEKVEAVYVSESSRVDLYLHSSTRPKLLELCQNVLLKAFLRELLEREGSGLRALLRDIPVDQASTGGLALGNPVSSSAGGAGGSAMGRSGSVGAPQGGKRADLRRMFTLVSEVEGGLVLMGEIFKEHVDKEGTAIVQKRIARYNASADEPTEAGPSKSKGLNPYDPDYIDELFRFWQTYHDVIRNEFSDSSDMQRSFRKALERVLNIVPGDRSHAELLATYVDAVLRGKHGNESLDEARIEALLQLSIELFRHVMDKDVFRDVYRNLLAKRLLLQKSASMEEEKVAITMLKHACGPGFTYRIEGMISDLNLAKDLDNMYHDHMAAVGSSTYLHEVHISVLKTGFWPGFQLLQNITLPPAMNACVQHFQSYYTSREPSKKLTWIWSQGTASIRVVFTDGWKDIVMTTLQAMVALLFNRTPVLTINDMASMTGIDKANLKRIVAPMCCAKGFKIIKKTPPTPVIKDEDLLEFDYTYKNSKREVTIPPPSLQDKKPDVIPGEERKETVDAAIVRIMKARKRLGHAELIQEVLQQIKFFRPDPRLIKSRIDALMGEYIRREDAMSLASPYVYMAGEE